MEQFHPELLFVESGGDNLAAQHSRELADFTVAVIDVAGGDKVPRRAGLGWPSWRSSSTFTAWRDVTGKRG